MNQFYVYVVFIEWSHNLKYLFKINHIYSDLQIEPMNQLLAVRTWHFCIAFLFITINFFEAYIPAAGSHPLGICPASEPFLKLKQFLKSSIVHF